MDKRHGSLFTLTYIGQNSRVNIVTRMPQLCRSPQYMMLHSYSREKNDLENKKNM